MSLYYTRISAGFVCLNHIHRASRAHGLKGNEPASVKQNYANKLPSGASHSTLVLKARVEEHQSLCRLEQLTGFIQNYQSLFCSHKEGTQGN